MFIWNPFSYVAKNGDILIQELHCVYIVYTAVLGNETRLLELGRTAKRSNLTE